MTTSQLERSQPGAKPPANDALSEPEVQRQLRRQNAVLDAVNRVLRGTIACDTLEEVAQTCLAVVKELTGSRFGFVGEINGAGLLDTIAQSDPDWHACRIAKSDAVKRIMGMKIRALWGSVIKNGRSLIVNEPASHPDRVGLSPGHPPLHSFLGRQAACHRLHRRCPPWHPPLHSFLGVPLKHADKTVGMVALANKEGGYDEEDQQAVEALAAVFVEVLRRKRDAVALAASEDRYRRITEAVTDYTFTVRLKDGCPAETTHGASCISVTGYGSAEFASDPYLWFRMVHEEDRKLVQEHIRAILVERSFQPIEHRIYRKDGVARWVRNTPVPQYDQEGRLIAYDGLIRDITERKQAEEALRLTNTELKAHREQIEAQRAELIATNQELESAIEGRNGDAPSCWGVHTGTTGT